MSFLKKALASIGVGSATVDTILNQDKLQIGEQIQGIVKIKGGNIDQQIDSIYLSLLTTYKKEIDDKTITKTAVIEQYKISEFLVISSNEVREIPFSFKLPLDSPITIGKSKVWIQTGLDIKNAVDPTDKDFIGVIPAPIVQSILESVSNLGFQIRSVECEEAPYRLRKRLPFIQEFEFIPVRGSFRGKLDEIELMFFPHSLDNVEVLMQIDRKVRGLGSFLAEAFDMDESFVRFTVTKSDLPTLTNKIQGIINQYC